LASAASTWTIWAARTRAVLEKDLLSEARTRYALNAVLLFAVTSLVSVSFALAGVSPSVEVQAALLWVLIFFAAMAGLSRVFVHEEERGTAPLLRLAASASIVFCGKFLFNLSLLILMEVILVPLYIVLMGLKSPGWGLFLLAVGLGSTGLAATGTLLSAIVAKARTRNALFAALGFPVLLPVLVAGVAATRIAMTGGSIAAGGAEIKVLASYAVVAFTSGLLLFDYVWLE
jgi:heme exporter protein B